jgi:hypothetical protein
MTLTQKEIKLLGKLLEELQYFVDANKRDRSENPDLVKAFEAFRDELVGNADKMRSLMGPNDPIYRAPEDDEGFRLVDER